MKDVHDNSTQSHLEHERSGRGESYRQKIIDLLITTGKSMTDREIFTTLGVEDVNNIRPEITRLKQKGTLVETGSIKCPVTGKKVRLVYIKNSLEIN